MAKEILRMNYFKELFLDEAEFKLEQDYYIRMRRLHNAGLHTTGIVWGLKVEKKSDQFITISEGMALDKVKDTDFGEYQSREIINTDIIEIDLKPIVEKILAGRIINLFVYAIYSKEDGKITQNVKGKDKPKQIKETIKIEVSENKPRDESNENRYIMLAKVDYDKGINKIKEIHIDNTDPTQRSPDAGAFNGTFETKTLKLSMDSPSGTLATINGSKFLTPSGDVNGIRINSPMTEFSGSLKILGGMDITGNLTISGTVDGRHVSADGTLLEDHCKNKSNPHGTTAAQIDGTDQDLINCINSSLKTNPKKINKNFIDSSVGSTGWVKLPFLPRKYLRNTSSQSYPEFEIREGHSISYLKAQNGTSVDGAFGVMEIPIPPYATRISKIRIGGKNAGTGIKVSLFRISSIPVSTSSSIPNSTTATFTESKLINAQTISGGNFFVTIDSFPATLPDVIGFPAQINPDYDTLTLYVSSLKESDIYFVAAYFEVV